jgi:t-SNARE complex subunit (syntaxin)
LANLDRCEPFLTLGCVVVVVVVVAVVVVSSALRDRPLGLEVLSE